jgi:adenosine kinase
VRVPVVPAHAVVDPTGVGDAFRAGFLAGLAWGLSHERCAQVGSLLATHVLETVGTQEYRLEPRGALARFAEVYGDEAASEVARHVRGAVPA